MVPYLYNCLVYLNCFFVGDGERKEGTVGVGLGLGLGLGLGIQCAAVESVRKTCFVSVLQC